MKTRSSNGASWIRRGLVMFQFTASTVLICVTIAVFLQIRHGQNRPLGFDKQNLLRVSGVSKIPPQAIRDELGKNPYITNVSFSNDPLLFIGSSSSGFNWQGKDDEINPQIHRCYITPDYIETIGLKLFEGRAFDHFSEADSFSVVINKTLADLMGDEGKLNGELWQYARRKPFLFKIVGIMDDYICDDIYKAKSEPMMFHKNLGDRPLNCCYIRFDSRADIGSVLKTVQSTISQFTSDSPLSYEFVDDLVNRLFDDQRQQGFLVALFSLLSVLVSCLGLLGLVTYIAESKIKDIGIRKVFGASAGNLVWMLTKEFLILVAISALIAFPLAYNWIDNLFQDYAYRISIGWEIFLMSLSITLLLTILTVGWKARKTATTNPVNALKVE